MSQFQLGRCCSLLQLVVLLLFGTSTSTAEEITQDPSTWYVDGCLNNPDTLSNAFGKHIPQTCIDVAYQDDGVSQQTKLYQRCYYTYVPDSCFAQADTMKQLPLVMDLHGLSGCPLSSASYTGWMEKAEEECFVVVWPTGDSSDWFNCWNLPGYLRSDDHSQPGGNNVTTQPCCCFEQEGADDPLFLKLAIDNLLQSSFGQGTPPVPITTTTTEVVAVAATKQADSVVDSNSDSVSITIDPDRVYMAGHSNGCMASMAMAALHPDSITAVCCHAGATITPFPENDGELSSLPAAVPIMWIHGMKDTTVPFDGNTIVSYPPYGRLGFWSVNESLDYLADKYGCLEEETTDLVLLDDDNTAGKGIEIFNGDDDDLSSSNSNRTIVGNILRRKNCRSNAIIEVVALYEADHYPYKMADSPLESDASRTEIDTTAMAWEFCSSYVKQRTPLQEEPPSSGTESPMGEQQQQQQQQDGAKTTPPEDESSTTATTENEEQSVTSSGRTLRSRKAHNKHMLSALSWSVLSGVLLGWVSLR